MLLRLACLGITNAFALLRLLPGSDRDKDTEILVLRHQLAVLQRQLGGKRIRFEPADRAWLAVLLSTLSRSALQNLRLLVRPDTVLRWHRDLHARRHAAMSRPRPSGPAPHSAFGPCAGAAPGRGEPVLGIPARARRTTHPRRQNRRVHGWGDPARGGNRSGPGPRDLNLGPIPAF